MSGTFDFPTYLVNNWGVASDVAAHANSGPQSALIIVADSEGSSVEIFNAIYALDESIALTAKNCAIDYAETHSVSIGNDALVACITV